VRTHVDSANGKSSASAQHFGRSRELPRLEGDRLAPTDDSTRCARKTFDLLASQRARPRIRGRFQHRVQERERLWLLQLAELRHVQVRRLGRFVRIRWAIWREHGKAAGACSQVWQLPSGCDHAVGTPYGLSRAGPQSFGASEASGSLAASAGGEVDATLGAEVAADGAAAGGGRAVALRTGPVAPSPWEQLAIETIASQMYDAATERDAGAGHVDSLSSSRATTFVSKTYFTADWVRDGYPVAA